jgi:hypothetical protein
MATGKPKTRIDTQLNNIEGAATEGKDALI